MKLYETTRLDPIYCAETYVSLNGYTMQRERTPHIGKRQVMGNWVLRNPEGSFVDTHMMRNILAATHGFSVDNGVTE